MDINTQEWALTPDYCGNITYNVIDLATNLSPISSKIYNTGYLIWIQTNDPQYVGVYNLRVTAEVDSRPEIAAVSEDVSVTVIDSCTTSII